MFCLTVTSAFAKGFICRRLSPTSQWKMWLSFLSGLSVRNTGASGWSALKGSTTTGSGSYSTSTASMPSAASVAVCGQDRRDFLCLIHHLFHRQDHLLSDIRVGIQCRLYLARVFAGDDVKDTGNRQGFGGVNVFNCGVGVGAADNVQI